MSDEAKARARIVFARVAGTLDDWSWAANGETIIAAALAAEREAGWRAGVEAAREEACKHTGWAPSSERWTVAAEIEAAIRALPYPTPAQEGGDATSQVEPQSTPASYDDAPAVTSGGGQPAEVEIMERARASLSLWGSRDCGPLANDARDFARALLAEHARAEALQTAGFAYRDQMRAEVSRATAAEAALAEARVEIERLKVALSDIGQSGPVNDKGEHDPYAGWSWCYERARAALEAGR